MPIRTLEHLKQSAPNDFLRDFIDTAYHWREQPVAAKRRQSGRIDTTTEVEVAPEPLPPSVTAPVYWNGVLSRPQILVDIGAEAPSNGSGGLARVDGRWTYKPFITSVDLYNYLHAPSHQWDGADPIAGQQISGLRISDSPTFASVIFDPAAPVPERATGKVFWDPDNHTLSAHLEGTSTTGQFFMEQLIYGQNDSSGPHLNGTVGYIKGSQGQRPTIDTARADDRLKSLAIVFSTEATIDNNNSGYYTVRGMVRDFDTSAVAEGQTPWLQAVGGYGAGKPSPSINNRNVSLGTVIRQHATTGSVLVDIKCYPFLDELSGVGVSNLKNGHTLQFNGIYWQNEPWYKHRFPIDDQGVYEVTLSYSSTTRRPTLAPTGATFSVWINGVKHVFTGAQALPQHGTASGKYFYYVDENGAFQVSSSPFNLLAWAPVALVTWNSAKGEGKCCPELHTTRMSARTHERLHEVQGSEVGRRSGFSASGFTYNLDTVAGVTFGISGGLLWDEDIKHVIPSLTDGSTYEIWYRTGASGEWTWDSASILPYKTGTTYATSNVFTGGAWTQVELDGSGAGEYTNMFVVVSPCINGPQIILVQGQGDFASQALAEAQGFDSLDLGTLPWMEYACIYRATFESQVAFATATKKTVLVSLTRITTASGGSGATAGGEHNSLSGRDALDCHPAMAITDFYGLSLGQIAKRGSSSMVPAVPNTDYLAVNNPVFTGTLRGPAVVIGTPTVSGSGNITVQGNDNASNGFGDINWNTGVGGVSVRRMTARWEESTGSVAIFSSNDDGSSRVNRLRIYRDSLTPVRAYAGFDVNSGNFLVGNQTVVDSTRKGFFQGLEVQSGTVRVVPFGAGFVRSDSSGVLSSSPLIAGDLPLHTHPYLPINNPDFTGTLTGPQGALTGALSINSATAAAWGAAYKTLRVGLGGSVVVKNWPVGDSVYLFNNAYRDASDATRAVSGAGNCSILSIGEQGNLAFQTASNPGAGNIATTVEKFSVNASGDARVYGLMTVSSLGSGFVRSNSSGVLSSSALLASELPNHASRHHSGGADPLSGQSIAGLLTTSSPTFNSLSLNSQGDVSFGSAGIGVNGFGELYLRDVGGNVRVFLSPTELHSSVSFSASSGRFSNLSTGIVKSNSIGQLVNGTLAASELPNHATRHEYGGADALAGQSIAGLRTVDSPSFTNLSLSGYLRLPGFAIRDESSRLTFETFPTLARIAYMDEHGVFIESGLYPLTDGIECGSNDSRWNFKSNDLDHDCDVVTATNTTPGASILTIPFTGNYFTLTNGSGGGTRNYRIPNAPGSGIAKRIVLFSRSTDPDGFTRIYPPSSGQLWNKDVQVTTFIEFNSPDWGLKIAMDSDGSNWYI